MRKNNRHITGILSALIVAVLLLLSLTGCGKEKLSFPPPTAEQLAAVRAAEQTPMRLVRSNGPYRLVEYIYDEAGRLVREEIVDPKTPDSPNFHREYTYQPQPDGTTHVTCKKRNVTYDTYDPSYAKLILDADGKCIEQAIYAQDKYKIKNIKNTYEYDDHGRILVIHSEQDSTEVGEQPTGKVYLLKSEFEWNNNGQLNKIVIEDVGLRRICNYARNQNGEVIGRTQKQEYIDIQEKTVQTGLRMGHGSALLIPIPRFEAPPDVFTQKDEYAVSYENNEDGRLSRKTMHWVRVPHENNTEWIEYLYDENGALAGVKCVDAGLDMFAQMLTSYPWKFYWGIDNFYGCDYFTDEYFTDKIIANMTTEWEVIVS